MADKQSSFAPPNPKTAMVDKDGHPERWVVQMMNDLRDALQDIDTLKSQVETLQAEVAAKCPP